MAKGQGNNSQNDGHDISNNPFPRGDPDAERNSIMMASINRSQTYQPIFSHQRLRKELGNWNWV